MDSRTDRVPETTQEEIGLFCFDTETYKIQPGLQAPPVVCGQWPGFLALAEDFKPRFIKALKHERLVGHNVAFDMACCAATWPELLPAIIKAYEEDRVTCTQIREKLIRIAEGSAFKIRKYSLIACLERWGIEHEYNVSDDGHKEEYWRTRYSTLKDTPVSEWPPEAVRYALEDAHATEKLFMAQELADPALLDQYRQTRGAFWIRLMQCHGLVVDQGQVHSYRKQLEKELQSVRTELELAGIVRPNGTRNLTLARTLIAEAYAESGLPMPLSPKGKEILKATEQRPSEPRYACVDADACKGSGDARLVAYARYGSLQTLIGRTDRLKAAGHKPIQAGFDVLKETGRTSSFKGKYKPGQEVMAYGDQLQNMPREPGLRECYIARANKFLISVDWSSAELHTLAQACIYHGIRSHLAETLRSGRDAHLAFGAAMKGYEYDWAKEAKAGKHGPEAKKAVKEARQAAKCANFGFPGGLGVEKFRLFSLKSYGMAFSDREAKDLKDAWFSFYPEMPEYFQIINELVNSERPLKHFTSHRLRGRVRYTSACNSFFQGMAADMAKDAGFQLMKRCYLPGDVLYGSRIVNFIHDEFIVEAPQKLAHECAMSIVEVMEKAGEKWCPDCPVKAEPAISYRWMKEAEPAYIDGRLVAWEDRETQ